MIYLQYPMFQIMSSVAKKPVNILIIPDSIRNQSIIDIYPNLRTQLLCRYMNVYAHTRRKITGMRNLITFEY